MEALTILLLERIGLLLIVAFLITRVPSFRYLMNRDLDRKMIIYHSLVFGVFGIAGVQAGVVIHQDAILSHLWLLQLQDGEMLAGSSLFAIVIAGLLGGPFVGAGSGLIVSVFLYYLGGDGMWAGILVNPISGLLAGLTGRFFSDERVIAPEKTLFIGIFAPILHMSLLLIVTKDPESAITLVNKIGLPLVISNSLAIVVFTAMLHMVLRETDQEAANETTRALKIVDQSIPYLKNGFNQNEEAAMEIAELLYKELKIAGVTITNRDYVLAHAGLGTDHHAEGKLVLTTLSSKALDDGKIQVGYQENNKECERKNCPLQAVIIIPIKQSNEIIGLIKLFYKRPQQIRTVETAMAKGLGKFISNQLDIIVVDKMRQHLQEAELRNLQTQINPHFLFNTLHLIDSLIRTNPVLARRLIVQLSTFMRSSSKIALVPLIPIDEELKHVKAYLEIVNTRFSDQLHVSIHVPEYPLTAEIPPFTLQPLIENSLQHGLRDADNGGEVLIEMKQKKTKLHVVITDNGTGIDVNLLGRLGDETVPSKRGNGTGLYNVNQRLIALLGHDSRLHIANQLTEKGSRISFQLPLSIKRTGEKTYGI